MSFWEHLLGNLVGHAIRDAQKEKEQIAKKSEAFNRQFDELQQLEEELNQLLQEVGSPDSYIFDATCIEQGQTASEKKKISQYRDNVKKYISLGGEGKFIYNVRNIDDSINRIIYLKSVNALERQFEFADKSCDETKQALQDEKYDFSTLTEIVKSTKIHQAFSSNINSLSGVEFERVCQLLLERMGLQTKATKASRDGGIDIIAYNDQPLLAGKYIIQCKRYSGSVGEPIIRDLYGVVMSERANKGILMTTGYFTTSARAFAADKQIELMDSNTIYMLMSNYGLISSEDDADSEALMSILDAYYCDYQYFARIATTEPLKGHCGMAEVLHHASNSRLFKPHFGTIPMLTTEEVKCAANVLLKHVDTLVANPSLGSKKGRYIYYMSLLMAAEASFWNGEFTKSISLYTVVLDEWKDSHKDNGFITWVVGSVFSMLNIMELPEYVDAYYQKYYHLINKAYRSYRNSLDNANSTLGNSMDDFYRRMVTIVEDKHHVNQFISISLYDGLNNTSSKMVDNCLTDGGDIDIGCGAYFLDVDKDNDTITVYLKKRATGEKNLGAVIINNFQSVATKQREQFLALVSSNA